MAKTNVKGNAKKGETTIKTQKESKEMKKSNEMQVGSTMLLKVRDIIGEFEVLGIEEKAVLLKDLSNDNERKFLKTVVNSAWNKQAELKAEMEAMDEDDEDVEEVKPTKKPVDKKQPKGKKALQESEDEDDLDEDDEDDEDLDDIDEDDEDMDDDESEDDDSFYWEEKLEGLTLAQLKRIAGVLGVDKAEIKGRDEADLIAVITEYDDDDIEDAAKDFFDKDGNVKVSKEAPKAKAEPKAKGKGKKEEPKKNAKYWEEEDPITSELEGLEIRLYENANRLQLLGCYRDKDNERQVGKGITVKTDELTEKEAMKLIANIVYATKGAIADSRIEGLVAQLESLNQEINPDEYDFTEADLNSYELDKLVGIAKGLGITKVNPNNKKKALVSLILKAKK